MNSKVLYNPFYYFAGFKSFFIGLAGFLVTCYLTYKTGTHFNGLLNIDFAKDSDFWVYLLENISQWIILSITLYLAGFILSKSKIRFIDILGTTLLSRLPLLIAPLFRTITVFQSFGYQSVAMYFILIIYYFSLCWTIALLFHAYKVSCNLKDNKLIVSFIICTLLTEVLTKTLLYLII